MLLAVITVGVVAGRVIEVKPHPHGDHIRLALVDLGHGKKAQIVFGGLDVVTEGCVVPVAPPGARLPGIGKLRTRQFRGERSHGMFCSLTELGWATECPDEVALLSSDIPAGESLDDLDDTRRREIVVNADVPGFPISWSTENEELVGV